MYFDDFIWLPEIIDKLLVKHQVLPEEVEEVFFNQPHFRFVERGYQLGEDVYAAYGRTLGGRYLIVFFIHKAEHLALILSARTMDKQERKRYEHHK